MMTALAKTRLSCKTIQLVLACACIGLYSRAPVRYEFDHYLHILMPMTFGGFIFIQAGLLLGYFTSEQVPKRIDYVYTAIGFVFFFSVGIVGVLFYQPKHDAPRFSGDNTGSYGLVSSSLSIINSAVFLFDMVLSYRDVAHLYMSH